MANTCSAFVASDWMVMPIASLQNLQSSAADEDRAISFRSGSAQAGEGESRRVSV
jgi:hypothetical protein